MNTNNEFIKFKSRQEKKLWWHTVYYVIIVLGVGFIKTEPFNLSSLFTEEKVLQDLSGFWSYNDTSDISKYEDFDHSKLLGKKQLIFMNFKGKLHTCYVRKVIAMLLLWELIRVVYNT